jgi:hypothetical protein
MDRMEKTAMSMSADGKLENDEEDWDFGRGGDADSPRE